jgi:hypothetical protein
MEMISKDDSDLYQESQLKNFNKFYFDPYLNETIPYREDYLPKIENTRKHLLQHVEIFEKI